MVTMRLMLMMMMMIMMLRCGCVIEQVCAPMRRVRPVRRPRGTLGRARRASSSAQEMMAGMAEAVWEVEGEVEEGRS
jgi:hypothetical protein